MGKLGLFSRKESQRGENLVRIGDGWHEGAVVTHQPGLIGVRW